MSLFKREKSFGEDACNLKESPHLEKLKELTKKLPASPFVDIVSNIQPNSYSIETIDPLIKIDFFPLYFDGVVRIERAFGAKDAVTKKHYHVDELQFMIVYSGEMEVMICPPGKEQIKLDCLRGNCCYINANHPHSVKFIQNTWVINIFLPIGVKQREPVHRKIEYDESK